MTDYKGVKIEMFEGTSFKKGDIEVESEKLFYVASSKYGYSLANQPQQALDGAKEQVDRNKK